ncbi:unnamed protein product [Rangifer tarandus platyrhynchus]|uniref:Uncharacterized protein n=1 Tax=Rangifer tarandus platyrhynchus TaxID=3082113 RepID=A0AC60A0X4_RANTA
MCYSAQVMSLALDLISYGFKINCIHFNKSVAFLLHPPVHTALQIVLEAPEKSQVLFAGLSPYPSSSVMTSLVYWAFTGSDKYPPFPPSHHCSPTWRGLPCPGCSLIFFTRTEKLLLK